MYIVHDCRKNMRKNNNISIFENWETEIRNEVNIKFTWQQLLELK